MVQKKQRKAQPAKKQPSKRRQTKQSSAVARIQQGTNDLVQSSLDSVQAGQEERNRVWATHVRYAQEETKRLRQAYADQASLKRRSFYEGAERRPGNEQSSFIEGPFPDTPNFENIMLRAKARALMRNNSYARALRDFVVSRMCPP